MQALHVAAGEALLVKHESVKCVDSKITSFSHDENKQGVGSQD